MVEHPTAWKLVNLGLHPFRGSHRPTRRRTDGGMDETQMWRQEGVEVTIGHTRTVFMNRAPTTEV